MNSSETQNWAQQLQRDMLFAPINRQELLDDITNQTEDLLEQWQQVTNTAPLTPDLVGPTLIHLSRLTLIEEARQRDDTQQLQNIIDHHDETQLAQLATDWLSPTLWFDQMSKTLSEHPTHAVVGQTLLLMEKLQLLRATLWSYDVMIAQDIDIAMMDVEEALANHMEFHEHLPYHSQWIHQQASLIDPQVPEQRYFYLPWYDMLAQWLDHIESEQFTNAIVELLISQEQAPQAAPIIDLQSYIDAQSPQNDDVSIEMYEPRAAQASKQAGGEKMLRWRGAKLGWEAFINIKDEKHQPDDVQVTMLLTQLPLNRKLRLKIGTEDILLQSSTGVTEMTFTMGQLRQWTTNGRFAPVVIDRLLIDVGKRIR